MTKEQVHEALCQADDADKMRLACTCLVNGVDIQTVEQTLANVLTGVQKSLEPALEYYRYLGGK